MFEETNPKVIKLASLNERGGTKKLQISKAVVIGLVGKTCPLSKPAVIIFHVIAARLLAFFAILLDTKRENRPDCSVAASTSKLVLREDRATDNSRKANNSVGE